MEKNELKSIKISETIINHLSSGFDCTEEWVTNADIDFKLSKACEFSIYCDVYVIDRIKLICSWDGCYLYYANDKEYFHTILVSKTLVKKVYDELLIVQKEERFKNHSFEGDLMDMLRGERDIALF